MSALKVGGILEWPSQRELGRAGLGQGAGEPQWAQEQEGLASAHCPTAWLHPGLYVPADGCPCCETGAEWGAEPAPQLLSSTPAPAAGSAETSLTLANPQPHLPPCTRAVLEGVPRRHLSQSRKPDPPLWGP